MALTRVEVLVRVRVRVRVGVRVRIRVRVGVRVRVRVRVSLGADTLTMLECRKPREGAAQVPVHLLVLDDARALRAEAGNHRLEGAHVLEPAAKGVGRLVGW